MALPTFEIIELTDENTAEMLVKYASREEELVPTTAESHINRVIKEYRRIGGRQFLLSWNGYRMPLDAVINTHQITWTGSGQVNARPGGNIGAYTRLVDCGGKTREEQVMVIYLYRHFSQTDNDAT